MTDAEGQWSQSSDPNSVILHNDRQNDNSALQRAARVLYGVEYKAMPSVHIELTCAPRPATPVSRSSVVPLSTLTGPHTPPLIPLAMAVSRGSLAAAWCFSFSVFSFIVFPRPVPPSKAVPQRFNLAVSTQENSFEKWRASASNEIEQTSTILAPTRKRRTSKLNAKSWP